MFRVLPFNIKTNVERGRDLLGNLVDTLVDQPLHPLEKAGSILFPFRVDVIEMPDCYEIHAELPGFLKEEITLTYEDEQYLTIRAERAEAQITGRYLAHERRSGKFERSFQVDGIEAAGIEASSTNENGVLRIRLPKHSEETPKTVIDIG